MNDRKYLPTFADLVDRLSIVLLKMIYIPENRHVYEKEREAIEHDLALYVDDASQVVQVRAIMVIMLANVTIWRNESEARKGGSGANEFLRFTHSVNGVRNAAKNILAQASGERTDKKVDALAADLPKEFGCWDLFSDVAKIPSNPYTRGRTVGASGRPTRSKGAA